MERPTLDGVAQAIYNVRATWRLRRKCNKEMREMRFQVRLERKPMTKMSDAELRRRISSEPSQLQQA
jgi:hypothetical protein